MRIAPRRGSLLDRLVRALSVSALISSISLTVLVVGTTALGRPAWQANLVATVIGTVPSYILNRRWVWQRRDPSHPWREVLPFWVLSFAGLGLSTLAVTLADHWATHSGFGPGLRSVAVVASNLTAWGSLWVLQFVLLDRVLFARPHHLRHAHDAHPPAPTVDPGSTGNLKFAALEVVPSARYEDRP
jgi:putative flippase GtrA